jgi:hypothetical protein
VEGTIIERERFLSVRNAVDRSGFTERTVRGAIAAGRLAIVRPSGLRAIRIPESSFITWIRGRECAQPAPIPGHRGRLRR